MGQSRQREATAYHEAGHAVAAMRLGVGIGRDGLSIIPGEGFAGFVHVLQGFSGNPEFEVTGSMRLKAENRVIVCLAGPAAQRKFRPSSVRSIHGRSDRQQAIDLLSYFVGSDEELTAYLKLLLIRTKSLVSGPVWWPMIGGIANALMARKRLSATEAKTIAIDALGWPDPLRQKLAAITRK